MGYRILVLSSERLAWGARFSADELDRSIPFDLGREMKGDRGLALLHFVVEELRSTEHRQRARREVDKVRMSATTSALLANLFVAARNRIDHHRFVALSFHRADYAQTVLSATAIAQLRGDLLALGYLEGQTGYRRAASADGKLGHSRRTRIRATRQLIELFARFGIDRRHVGWRYQRDLIIMRSSPADIGPEPLEVAASRNTLRSVTDRIAQTAIVLPDEAWERVVTRYQIERKLDDESADERISAGDLTAVTLYRIFKGGWDCGGRIYGGWWINLPKAERANLRIDREPVVELDYSRLHPTLLFARVGIQLDFDPYLVAGVDGPFVRDLGKRSFNRLINKTVSSENPAVPVLAAMPQDRLELPEGMSFREFLERFIQGLQPISAWFGTGEGVRLQREDSDLAIEILRVLETDGIPVLPVHDSFLVARSNESKLRAAMRSAFANRYGFDPKIRPAQKQAHECETSHNWNA